MKKVVLASLLLIGALLLGLALPEIVTVLQTRTAERSEPAGITEVTLQVDSGLSHVEKLSILASDSCTLLDVGVARHQTPASLAQHSWALLEVIMSSYGAPLLDASTTQQIEQFAMLVSEGDRSFQFWEVLFSDGYGNLLRLHLDDETGLPLAMLFYAVEGKPVEDWCLLSMMALGEYCSLGLADSSYEKLVMDSSRFSAPLSVPVTDGTETCSVLVQLGDTWFAIGDRIG